jgi:hypothetical protein
MKAAPALRRRDDAPASAAAQHAVNCDRGTAISPGVDATDRRVQDDPTEYFETLNMLSSKPSAIRGCHNVILEDK